MKYTKSSEDQSREDNDIKSNPIMRWLDNQEHFKFQVGQVLIKQWRVSSDKEWQTENVPGVNAPRKFMYAFENKHGIGYLKQLKVDGSGFTRGLIFTANFDPETTRFQLDPDYVDHTLVGEGEFQYNKQYLDKKQFKSEAIERNEKILVNTNSNKARHKWFKSLTPGTTFWAGHSWEEFIKNKFTLISVDKIQHNAWNTNDFEYRLEVRDQNGRSFTMYDKEITWMRVSMQEPFPLEDPLCGPARVK